MNKFKYTRRLVVLITLVLAATSAAFAADGESQFAKLDGARIHYKSWGKGKDALVLVHGWGCNLNHWRDQIPDLSKRNRVIALDLPGHGESDKPQQLAYTMQKSNTQSLWATAWEHRWRDSSIASILRRHSAS